jgi:hypothetical protein
LSYTARHLDVALIDYPGADLPNHQGPDHGEEVGQHRLADRIDPMGVLNDIDRWLTFRRKVSFRHTLHRGSDETH